MFVCGWNFVCRTISYLRRQTLRLFVRGTNIIAQYEFLSNTPPHSRCIVPLFLFTFFHSPLFYTLCLILTQEPWLYSLSSSCRWLLRARRGYISGKFS